MPKNSESNINSNGTCSICKEPLHTKSYCETCYLMLKLLGDRYSAPQLMTLYSHSIGAKITQTLAGTMANELKEHYNLKTGNRIEEIS